MANGIIQYDLITNAKCKCYFVTAPMNNFLPVFAKVKEKQKE